MRVKDKTTRSERGASLVELLTSMIVAVVIMLTICVISQISLKTYRKQFTAVQIYSDISYGFKLLQKHIREANVINAPDAPGTPWVGSRLVLAPALGNYEAFGLYQTTNSIDFVYLKNVLDETDREVLLSIPNTATSWITLTINPGTRLYSIQIQGEKNGVPFDMSTTILMRA